MGSVSPAGTPGGWGSRGGWWGIPHRPSIPPTVERSSPPSSMGTRQQSESSGVSGQAKSPPVRLAPWPGSAGAWGAPTSSLPWWGAPPRQGSEVGGGGSPPSTHSPPAPARHIHATLGLHTLCPSPPSPAPVTVPFPPHSCPHTPAPMSRRWCQPSTVPAPPRPTPPPEQLRPQHSHSQASAAARCTCGQGMGRRG